MPRTHRPLLALTVAMATACWACMVAAQSTHGVTDTEITVGTVTDLSGVTAIQGVNNANAIRLLFDEANEKGGINGRKIRYIVEDSQYQIPRAVQAMNKLLNNDKVFMTLQDGGTPMNNATWPMAMEKNTPKLLPLSAARSMYEPYNKLKFSQTSSYVDQMRAGVKYFVEQRGKKVHLPDVPGNRFRQGRAGRRDDAGRGGEHEDLWPRPRTNRRIPTSPPLSTKLHEAKCDLIALGTIVRDTTIIISTVKKAGWDVDLVGQAASYDTAVATAPGGTGEGFYSMTPTLYVYPDDPRPEIRDLMARYRAKYGIDMNYIGQTGISVAQIALEALRRAGRDLTVDSLVAAMESLHEFTDIYGNIYSFGPDQHHGSTKAFLAVVKDGRWVPVVAQPLGY